MQINATHPQIIFLISNTANPIITWTETTKHLSPCETHILRQKNNFHGAKRLAVWHIFGTDYRILFLPIVSEFRLTIKVPNVFYQVSVAMETAVEASYRSSGGFPLAPLPTLITSPSALFPHIIKPKDSERQKLISGYIVTARCPMDQEQMDDIAHLLRDLYPRPRAPNPLFFL